MTLVTQGRSRERILVFGMEGVGKSDSLLDIAARVYPNKVYVIDNDNAWDRMLEGPSVSGGEVSVAAEWRWRDGEFHFDDRFVKEDGNVVVYHVSSCGWKANVAALDDVKAYAQPDDWCGIDTGGELWDAVSDWYVDKVFGQSKADFFLMARLAVEKDEAGGLDGWKDYSVINAEYRQHVMSFLITPPCHLFVTAEQAEVSSGQIKGKQIEDAETRNLYGGLQVKPRGQKRMGHNVQTVIQLRKGSRGAFSAYTVKDRGGREKWTGEDVAGRGFADWYLEETAGWVESEAAPSTRTPSGEASLPATPTSKGTSPAGKTPPPAQKMAAKE